MRKILLILFCLFFLVSPALATTYYVCVSGATCDTGIAANDWDTGTDDGTCGTDRKNQGGGEHPCASIEYAVNSRANDGDTVEVGKGTYTDHNTNGYVVGVTAHDGNASYITIKAETVVQSEAKEVILDMESYAGRFGIFLVDQDYIRFEGIGVINPGGTAMVEMGTGSSAVTTTNIWFESCYFYHPSSGGSSGYMIHYNNYGPSVVTLNRCIFKGGYDNNSVYLTGEKLTVSNSLFYGRGVDVTLPAKTPYIKLEGYGLNGYSPSSPNWHSKIINNTFYGIGGTGEQVMIYQGTDHAPKPTYAKIKNNIFHYNGVVPANDTVAINWDGWCSPTTSEIDNNILDLNGSTGGYGPTGKIFYVRSKALTGYFASETNNVVGQDFTGYFWDAASYDLKTKYSATAIINQGLDFVEDDYFDNARPFGAVDDIGAFENPLDVSPTITSPTGINQSVSGTFTITRNAQSGQSTYGHYATDYEIRASGTCFSGSPIWSASKQTGGALTSVAYSGLPYDATLTACSRTYVNWDGDGSADDAEAGIFANETFSTGSQPPQSVDANLQAGSGSENILMGIGSKNLDL